MFKIFSDANVINLAFLDLVNMFFLFVSFPAWICFNLLAGTSLCTGRRRAAEMQ